MEVKKNVHTYIHTYKDKYIHVIHTHKAAKELKKDNQKKTNKGFNVEIHRKRHTL